MHGNLKAWSKQPKRCAKSLAVHPEITLGSCEPCSHSDVTLTDSQPDNSIHAPPASCQSGRPSWGYWRSCQAVWDVSVKAHPHGHSVFPAWAVWRSSTVLLLPFLFSVCPSSSSETRQPLNPRSNHRFFGYTFVILRASAFYNGVLSKHWHTQVTRGLKYMLFLSLLVFACTLSALKATVNKPFSQHFYFFF